MMVGIVEALAGAAKPWSELYDKQPVVQGAVTFLHLAGILAAGGLAVAADRATIRAAGRSPDERGMALRELGSIHRPVVIGLALVVASGVLLLLSDVESLLPSPVYWAKMGAFLLLLVNGLLMQRAEARLAGAAPGAENWGSLRGAAWRSAFLWFATLLLGTILPLAA
ncbi:MAG: hypothetical protein JWM27_2993 [Gemmatimonadetes bacterium]|nr:hypothetical protein [Gemmatimonadota bacterium]